MKEIAVVNRFEVIDHTSSNGGDHRPLIKWLKENIKFGVSYSVQDDGRTLKIFLMDEEDTKDET